MEFIKLWIKARNVVLVLLATCIGLGSNIAIAQGNSSNSGFELDYFHAYRAARTYAIRLKNGLSATFDFRHGTATLYANGQQSTLPLNQVLLQAANGNSHLATQMYNQMYQGISAAHSDAIMKYVGTRRASTNSLRTFMAPPVTVVPGFGADDDMWSTPDVGDCWPIPGQCDELSSPDDSLGGIGFTTWVGVPFGSGPMTGGPPDPSGCDPNDVDCKIWENNRKNACERLTLDGVKVAGSWVVGAAACASVTETFGASSLACAGAIALYGAEAAAAAADAKACATPYPDP